MEKNRRIKTFLFLIAILLSSQFFVYSSTASAEKIVFYAPLFDQCSKCRSYFETLNSLISIVGVDEVQLVRGEPIVSEALEPLYQNLNVPENMQGKIVVSVDDRFLFINYVPVDFIADFLANYSDTYSSIVVYADELQGLYRILYEDGNIIDCEMGHSISECIGGLRLPFFAIFPVIVISGLLDGINPCAFAVLFFFLAFLYMARPKTSEKTKQRFLLVGSVYIMSVYLTYLMIGLSIIKAITIAPFPHLLAKIGAALCILFGIINIKDYFWPGRWLSLKIPKSQWKNIAKWIHKSTIPSAFIVGLMVGFIEFPCTGGIYLAILGMLACRTTFTQGFIYLLIYNVAFVLPLIIILVVSLNKRFVEKMRTWQLSKEKPMRLIMGLIMISIGVFLLFTGVV